MSTSFPFLGFALVVVLLYYVRRSFAWRQGVLLLANICFLGTFSQGILSFVPLAAFLVLVYAGLALIRKAPRHAFLPVLLATLAAFVWLKGYAFVPTSFALPFVYVTVGLSYILFRVLHLIIDIHTGAIPGEISFIDYFNYTANFTTLVSGPIQHYPDYVKMRNASFSPDPTSAGSRLSTADAAAGIERISKGLFKTNVVSLVLSTVHTHMVDLITAAQPVGTQFVAGAMIFVLYLLFIYYNFSGYIDMVIGIGRLLSFKLPENFDRPFSSDSFIDLWSRRWHITLSAWLKIYVYNPLLFALMRKFPSRKMEPVWAVTAFFVTFFLVGVWHGQTSEFICYGFLLGLGVSGNKIYQLLLTARMGRKQYAQLAANPLYIAIARGLTFTYFSVTTILFWSNWNQMRGFEAVLGKGLIALIFLGIFAGSTIVLSAWEGIYNWLAAASWSRDPILSQSWRAAWITALLVITLTVSILMNQAAPEIVYKAF